MQGGLRFVNKLRSLKIDFSKVKVLKNWFRAFWIITSKGGPNPPTLYIGIEVNPIGLGGKRDTEKGQGTPREGKRLTA